VENYPVNQGFHLVNSNYFLQFCCTEESGRAAERYHLELKI
jgi:hypothetical protein